MNENPKKEIVIQCPATIANLVCGFDILGMALQEPFDTLKATMTDSPGISITHTDSYGLPTDPQKNVAGVALQALLSTLKKPVGFNLEIHKNILPGSGLGSSAASAMGAVAAANMLLGNPFNFLQLVQFAMEGEKLAGGIAHADNVAPCLYGSITLISTEDSLRIDVLPVPKLFVTIIHPQIEIRTSDARKILKKEITLKKAIRQWSFVAGLVTGIFKQDYQLIRRSLQDVVFEPVRSVLIPAFDEIKTASLKAGALGGGIAGSGPSIFMLSETEAIAREVGQAMSLIYQSLGVDFKIYVTTIRTSSLI